MGKDGGLEAQIASKKPGILSREDGDGLEQDGNGDQRKQNHDQTVHGQDPIGHSGGQHDDQGHQNDNLSGNPSPHQDCEDMREKPTEFLPPDHHADDALLHNNQNKHEPN